MKALNKFHRAFEKQAIYKELFLECERAYNAVYKDEKRTSNLKNTHVLERSRLYVPLIKTTCDIIHSIFKTSFLSSGCPIEIKRIGMRSEHDLVLQNALNVLVKKHWQDASHKVGISRAVLSAIYLPLGCVQIYWDSGKVRTRHVSISDIAFDPWANDISDIDFVAYRWHQSKVELRKKFDTGFYKHEDPERLIHNGAYRSLTKEVYERRYENGRIFWKLSTYINNSKVREDIFDSLPFCYGYCLEAMPPVFRTNESDETYDNYIGVYGSALPLRVKELQKEYNIKRNQKIDLTEAIIDPQYIVAKNVGSVTFDDIYKRNKVIRAEVLNGARISDVIQPFQPINSTMVLADEIGIIKDEYERATGINSIMTGQTSPSDRRAMGALQVVNASSSMRVEAMLGTLADTMLNEYARKFVELIYQNASDDDIITATENPEIISIIGTKEQRAKLRLDFDIKTNFGTTISQELEISQLNNLMGVMAQSGLNEPKLLAPLLKDMVVLMRGENAPIEQIDEAFGAIIEQQQAAQQAAIAQQNAQTAGLLEQQRLNQMEADRSAVEAAAMEQARAVAEANEAEAAQRAAIENAAYNGGL